MTISPDKKYRTRGGSEVRIYAVDGRGLYSVHGAVRVSDGWARETWTRDGVNDVSHQGSPTDLVEIKRRLKRDVWVNVYPDPEKFGGGFSRQYADTWSATDRIACVKLTLDYEEGEGL